MRLVAIISLSVVGSVMSHSSTISLLVNVEFYQIGLRVKHRRYLYKHHGCKRQEVLSCDLSKKDC